MLQFQTQICHAASMFHPVFSLLKDMKNISAYASSKLNLMIKLRLLLFSHPFPPETKKKLNEWDRLNNLTW